MAVKTKSSSQKSFTHRMQDLAQEYMLTHDVETIELEEVSQWACETGRYQRHPVSMVKQCKRELADALRVQSYIDPQGREVRKMHPVRMRTQDHQMVIWADIETAKPEHMRISFSQSRQGISADCVAHNTIVESYNDNNKYSANLELFDYNFNPDVAEKKLPTEYPDEPPSES